MECAVSTCSNNWKKTKYNKDIVYHCFPKNKEIANLWLAKCMRADPVNIVNARICSIHFGYSDYFRDLEYELQGKQPRKRGRLKPVAVPSLHMPTINADGSCFGTTNDPHTDHSYSAQVRID